MNTTTGTAPTSETTPDWRGRALFAAVLAFFLLSGATGLVYQVVWTRKLVLLLGTTAYAVSTVLSIFFLGLGLGSLWGGRLADRSRSPLWVYGAFEVVIGLWAVAFILLIGVAEGWVVALLRLVEGSRAAGVGLRALLALGLLFVPVVLMGATLPLVARHAAQAARAWGFRVGALYSVNTFGAVTGTLAAGFLLLPALGYTNATFVAAAVNVAVGIAALALAGRLGALPAAAPVDATPVEPALRPGAPVRPMPARVRWAVLGAFAVSGFCSLGLEVLWTRLLNLIFLGTTYAYATMLATVLCGIAAGGAAASLFVDRLRRPAWAYGIVQALTAAAAIGMLAAFPGLPERLREASLQAGYDWGGIVAARFSLSFLALFPPTFLFGMSFPLAVRAFGAGRPGALGGHVGRLYAANTLGGVAGAAAGGFVLIPLLGTQGGVTLLAALLGLSGLVLLALAPGSAVRRAAGLVAGAAALAVAWLVAPGDVARSLNEAYLPEDHVLIDYREGVEGTVAVSQPEDDASGSNRVLWINAVQATASIEKGVKMNRLQGALPLLFDRDPETVLFMCLGSGITAGTLALGPFERIDAVEISADVRAFLPHFAVDNLDVAEKEQVRFIVDDGRNFLLRTDNRYDVITFEPMPLALAGVSTFYTREYYELCRERLTDDGLVSQWVPLHSLDIELVRSLIFTFAEVFPHYAAYFINADLFLIGSPEPLEMPYPHVEARLGHPPLAEALDAVWLPDVPEVITTYFMGQDAIDRFLAEGVPRIVTDDRPWAEFVAPKLVYEGTVDESLAALEPYYSSPVDQLTFGGLGEAAAAARREEVARRHASKRLVLEGLQVYYGGAVGSEPEKWFIEALDVDPEDYTARYYLKEVAVARARLFLRWQELEKGIAYLEDVLPRVGDDPDLARYLGDLYYEAERLAEAEEAYRRHVAWGGASGHVRDRLVALQAVPAPAGDA